MRLMPALAIASTLAIAACNRAEPPADNAANDMAAMPANDMMADSGMNAATGAAPAMNFTGGDGKALGSVTAVDSPAGLVLTLAGSGMPAESTASISTPSASAKGPSSKARARI